MRHRRSPRVRLAASFWLAELNTLVGFGDFPLLYLMVGDWVGYLPILVFCSVFNPLFSFFMHKYVTFASHEPAGREIGWYLFFYTGAFFASWGLLALIERWDRIWFIAAQIGFNVVLTIVNFIVVRRFVFRTVPQAADDP